MASLYLELFKNIKHILIAIKDCRLSAVYKIILECEKYGNFNGYKKNNGNYTT